MDSRHLIAVRAGANLIAPATVVVALAAGAGYFASTSVAVAVFVSASAAVLRVASLAPSSAWTAAASSPFVGSGATSACESGPDGAASGEQVKHFVRRVPRRGVKRLEQPFTEQVFRTTSDTGLTPLRTCRPVTPASERRWSSSRQSSIVIRRHRGVRGTVAPGSPNPRAGRRFAMPVAPRHRRFPSRQRGRGRRAIRSPTRRAEHCVGVGSSG
jgi:hypothetical protein